MSIGFLEVSHYMERTALLSELVIGDLSTDRTVTN